MTAYGINVAVFSSLGTFLNQFILYYLPVSKQIMQIYVHIYCLILGSGKPDRLYGFYYGSSWYGGIYSFWVYIG